MSARVQRLLCSRLQEFPVWAQIPLTKCSLCSVLRLLGPLTCTWFPNAQRLASRGNAELLASPPRVCQARLAMMKVQKLQSCLWYKEGSVYQAFPIWDSLEIFHTHQLPAFSVQRASASTTFSSPFNYDLTSITMKQSIYINCPSYEVHSCSPSLGTEKERERENSLCPAQMYSRGSKPCKNIMSFKEKADLKNKQKKQQPQNNFLQMWRSHCPSFL